MINWKKLIQEIIGGLFIGFSSCFYIKAALGSDSMTTMQEGLSIVSGIDIGIISILTNIFFIILLFIVDKKRVGIGTVINPVFITVGIDLLSLVLPATENMIVKIVYVMCGLLTVGIGVGLSITSDYGDLSYDGFVLAFSKKKNLQFNVIRWIFDGAMLITGIILKGSWGLGTVVALLLHGTVIQYFIKALSKK